MSRTFLQLLLMIALVLAASYFWEPLTGKSTDLQASASRQSLPKNYLESTRTWSYDDQGQLVQIIEAQRAEHYPQRDESLLQEPRYYSHHGDDRTWSGEARSGRYQLSKQTLTLQNEVKLINDQTGGALTSEMMVLDLNKKTAASIMPVAITQGEHTTHADAMLAQLDLEQIQLISNVESIYVPTNP
ncbi:MAG: LPS export ABC transporter protein LptC [Alcanivorax sp.]|jgi:LPS export ABC transporter protein LptC